MPAERADDLELPAVDNGYVVAKVGTEADVVAAFKPELLTLQDPFKDVLQEFRLAVSPFLFISHVVLQKKKAPTGANTDRGFSMFGFMGYFTRAKT
jgi:hypothetical protein